MPNVIIYQPEKLPQTLSTEQAAIVVLGLGETPGFDTVSKLLDCAPGLVYVLASGHGYIAYSVFDSEGEINTTAMTVLAELTGETFDFSDEDNTLRGPIVVVKEA